MLDDTRIDFDDAPALALRFERRRSARRPVCGTGMARFGSDDVAARITPIELVDEGSGGLCVLSPVPTEAGRAFVLFPHRSARATGPSVIRGEVASCVASGEGYRIGLRCAVARSAA